MNHQNADAEAISVNPQGIQNEYQDDRQDASDYMDVENKYPLDTDPLDTDPQVTKPMDLSNGGKRGKSRKRTKSKRKGRKSRKKIKSKRNCGKNKQKSRKSKGKRRTSKGKRRTSKVKRRYKSRKC